MIEQQLVDGREATVAYLTSDLKPASREDAELVRILFKDGDSRWLVLKQQDAQ